MIQYLFICFCKNHLFHIITVSEGSTITKAQVLIHLTARHFVNYYHKVYVIHEEM